MTGCTACAEEHGFQDVYTNDRHMLKAARHFHLTGVNVLSDKPLRQLKGLQNRLTTPSTER